MRVKTTKKNVIDIPWLEKDDIRKRANDLYLKLTIPTNDIATNATQIYDAFIAPIFGVSSFSSAASIPLALVESVEQGKVKLGSTAILTGFGAGMTWGGAIVRLREGIC